jgi:hypothetical protein
MPKSEFLVRDYELKANYLAGHHQRMWNRFGIFVSLESALFGGGFIFRDELSPGWDSSLGLAAVGCIVSLIWVLVGFSDLRILRVHEWHVRTAASNIKDQAGFQVKDFYPVGHKVKFAAKKVVGTAREPLKWLLLVILPLLTFGLWILFAVSSQ